MSVLRAFIAIELPPVTQEAIQKQTARLHQSLGDQSIRWVQPANLHITLKFLGDIAAAHLDFIKQSLTRLADSHSAFDLQIGGLGSFPNSKRPRILWVGLHAPTAFASLQSDVEASMVKLGYEKEERPFSSHLTIGRIKQNPSLTELQKIRATLDTIQLGNIHTTRVDFIHLYQSDLKPTGPVYTDLFSAKLKTNLKTNP